MILSVPFYSYHFVRTILSIPFCPMTFCPYTISSIPFCPYHFVHYHFVIDPCDTRQCKAAIAAMPLVIKLLLLGEGIVVKINKRKRTDRDRKTGRPTVAAAELLIASLTS